MLLGLLRLVRLSNSLPASVLVLLGAKLTGAPLYQPTLWVAIAAMWCITAFGYVSNDLWDQAEDRVNKPDRPLPAGMVTSRQAFIVALGLLLLALCLSANLGIAPFLITLLVLILLMLYNWRLKGMAGLGNLLIAGLAASALWSGAVAAHGWRYAPMITLLPAALALTLFILARELVKIIEDQVGDRLAGKQTLAQYIGVQTIVRIVACLTILLFLTVGWLFPWWGYSRNARVIMVAGVNLPLVWTVYYLSTDAAVSRVRRCLALLKGSYFFGLIALWLA